MLCSAELNGAVRNGTSQLLAADINNGHMKPYVTNLPNLEILLWPQA